MNQFGRLVRAGLFAVVGLSSFCSYGQTWTQIILQQGLTPQLVSADQLPRYGTFWSLQQTNMAPLPANLFPDLPVYYLGYGNSFLVDDSSVDYAALYAEQEAAHILRQLDLENGLLGDEEYWALEGGSPSAMTMSSLASSYAYGNAVYLVDMAATNAGALVTASFSIAGGTNNVPYDILTSANAASPIVDWNWIGIGYTSNRYTFSNQPLAQAFYILAKPQKTMIVGWGNSDYNKTDVPSGITNAVMTAGGDDHSLALLNDGTVIDWGRNDYGQRNVPTNLAGVTMIAAGQYHNVGLLTNGTVKAWGWNATGVYNLTDVPPDLTNAMVISAQSVHNLALRSNGTVVAWGYNGSGETNVPSSLSNVTAIAAGGQHSLAAKSDGTVVAWGWNTSGQCNVPAGLSNVWDVVAGWRHSVALRRDGTVVAWGDNSYGQTNVPASLSNVVAIAAGGDGAPLGSGYTLALKSDGTVVAWGQSAVNTPMIGLSNVIAIAGGKHHGLAIRSGPRTPVLTILPTDQYQIAGGDVTFTSRGAGLYGVRYQWKTNGVNLTGATNTTLTLTNVQAAQALNYTVAVSNEVGTITSSNAALTLVTPPLILSQSPLPTNQVLIFEHSLTLSVSASAPGDTNGFPLHYQWRFNGTNSVGGNSNSYTLYGVPANMGDYSVTVTNAAGSASAAWQVSLTYDGTYVAPGTLAYHLATNAVGRTNGYTPGTNMVELSGWTWEYYYPTNLYLLTNSVWSTNFWLKNVKGLSATAIGFLNEPGGQGLVTMVSPRHCLFAEHMHPGTNQFVAAFLDTNNVIYWRTNMESVHMPKSVAYGITNDMSVGILNEDLPSSVGFLQVLPADFTNYFPTNNTSIIQGIGMNQNMRLFSQPMTMVDSGIFVNWTPLATVPFGLCTNWNALVCCGDSSAPERLLIGDQLVLAGHNFHAGYGPIYSLQINTINEYMHYLSTNKGATEFQLTQFPLTNWPSIH